MMDSYSEGYSVGWDTGNQEGYTEGYAEAVRAYEERLSALWTEIRTLNARVDFLEKHTGLY